MKWSDYSLSWGRPLDLYYQFLTTNILNFIQTLGDCKLYDIGGGYRA